jgi:hypothetical protein
MSIKKLLLLVLLFVFSVPAFAQQSNGTGSNPATYQSLSLFAQSTNCSVAASCIWEKLPSNALTTAVTLSGTFSVVGTVEASGDGGTTFPVTLGTCSAAGTTTYSVGGYTDIRCRITTYTSGVAIATINTTVNTGPQGPAGPAGGGGSAPTGTVYVPSSTVTISPLNAAYGGIADATTLTVDLSSGGSTLVSAGLFTPSFVGKVVFCMFNNFGNDALALTTVTGYTDSSHITVAGTIVNAFAGASCAFASQNFATALNAATAALPPGGTLVVPCGYMIISGAARIFTTFTNAGSGPVNIQGCANEGSHFIMDYATMSTTSQPAISMPNLSLDSWFTDMTFDTVGSGNFQPGASIQTLINLSGGHVQNIDVNNWNSSGGFCFTTNTDGSTWRNVTSSVGGCDIPLHLFNGSVTLIQDGVRGIVGATASIKIEGQETGDSLIGGRYLNGIIINGASGNSSNINFYNVTAGPAASNCSVSMLTNSSPTHAIWTGGSITAALSGNSTGVCLASNTFFHSTNAEIDSVGTGFAVNASSGSGFYDSGTYSFMTGAGFFTGAGSLNGKSTLTGSAYTNATTSFTNVVGSTGSAFQWYVLPNQNLNVTCHLYYQAAATGGLNIEFIGPASPTSVVYGLNDPNAATTFNSSVATSYSTSLGQVVSTASTNFDATVTLSVVNGTTGGAVNLLAKASANVANGLTIQPGSYCQSQ